MPTSQQPQRPTPRQMRILRFTLLAVGAAWTAFFVAFVPIVLFDPIDHQSLAGRLLLWGHGGEEYLAMITAINLVIGLALLRSARDPGAYAQTIDVCLAINVAHMATMLLMALGGRHHHQHLVGDVVLGVGATAALAAVWLPVRGPLRDQDDPDGTTNSDGSSAPSHAWEPNR